MAHPLKTKIIAATARKMLKVVYFMLKEREPFHIVKRKPRTRSLRHDRVS